MKLLTEKKFTYKMIIVLVFIILFNFSAPTISSASAGGILFEPIKDLLLVIADGIISITQSMLLGMSSSFLTLEYQKSNSATILGWVARNRSCYCCSRFNCCWTIYWRSNMGSFSSSCWKSPCCRNSYISNCKNGNNVCSFKGIATKIRVTNVSN